MNEETEPGGLVSLELWSQSLLPCSAVSRIRQNNRHNRLLSMMFGNSLSPFGPVIQTRHHASGFARDPIVSAARDQSDAGNVTPEHHAKTIVLDLVNSAGPLGGIAATVGRQGSTFDA